MTNEIKGGGSSQAFDYKQVDEQMAEFLRRKESNMREIVGKAYTELGKELYEAQQRLSSHNKYEGVFEKWYTHLGWKKQTVYNLINRYELVQKLDNIDDKERIEELPATLSYEIANPNSESTPAKAQAKAEVLSGNIDTLKEYKERIAQLEKQADIERRERERLEEENEQLAKQADKPAEVRTEYVEVIPDDYEQVKKEREELERALEEANPFSEEPYGVKLGLAMYDAFEELSKWQKEYSWILTDATEFQKLVEADPNFAREFSRLDKFWKQMSAAFNGVRSKGTYREESETAEIIDVEFTEVI